MGYLDMEEGTCQFSILNYINYIKAKVNTYQEICLTVINLPRNFLMTRYVSLSFFLNNTVICGINYIPFMTLYLVILR